MNNALFLDFDGVIIDSESAWGQALIDVLAEDGSRVAFPDFANLLGTTGPDNDERWREFISAFVGPAATLEAIQRRMAPKVRRAYEGLPLLPGVRDLLDAAREAGWATGLGTGNTGPVERHIERLGLSAAFDATVRTYGSSLASKPAPDVFLALAARLQVRPEHCVVVEDSVPGCQAALAAGMSVIVCPTAATQSCAFPDGPMRVGSLSEVKLKDLEDLVHSAQTSPVRR